MSLFASQREDNVESGIYQMVLMPEYDVAERTPLVLLGCGAKSLVFLVVSTRQVVVKRLCRNADQGLMPHEAAILSILPTHPHIVEYLGASYTDKFVYLHFRNTFSMQTLEKLIVGRGEPWKNYSGYHHINETSMRRGTTEKTASMLFRQIMIALEHCHRHGVAHMDVKPPNILVERIAAIGDIGAAVHLRLIDFGYAYYSNPDSPELVCPTKYPGTLLYVAPELLLNKENYCPYSTDVWSAGIVYYTMLFGRVPFCCPRNVAESTQQRVDFTRTLILRSEPSFTVENRTVSADIQWIISRLLQKNPSLRPTPTDVLQNAVFNKLLNS